MDGWDVMGENGTGCTHAHRVAWYRHTDMTAAPARGKAADGCLELGAWSFAGLEGGRT
mgnify:CR=1 FL=1